MLKTLGVQLRASMPVPCQRELACDKARSFKYVTICDTTNISSETNSTCRKTEGLLPPAALSLKFFKLCAFRTAFPTACMGGARSSRYTNNFALTILVKVMLSLAPHQHPWRPSKKGSCHGSCFLSILKYLFLTVRLLT